MHSCIRRMLYWGVRLLYINAGCHVRVYITHKQGGYEDVSITRECVLR